jgi:hypothetical protein
MSSCHLPLHLLLVLLLLLVVVVVVLVVLESLGFGCKAKLALVKEIAADEDEDEDGDAKSCSAFKPPITKSQMPKPVPIMQASLSCTPRPRLSGLEGGNVDSDIAAAYFISASMPMLMPMLMLFGIIMQLSPPSPSALLSSALKQAAATDTSSIGAWYAVLLWWSRLSWRSNPGFVVVLVLVGTSYCLLSLLLGC